MNIKKDLVVTDNLNEQIAIGKELAETYDDSMRSFIMSYFDRITNWNEKFPEISKQDMLYKSTYDYWMYGVRPDQQIYYQFFHKTHDEKKTYMGQMEELVYYARLNKKADMNVVEDKYEAYKLLQKFYKREIVKISSSEDYELFLDFVSRHPKFVLKPLGLHDGFGIRMVDTKEEKDLHRLFASILNVGEAFKDDFSASGYSTASAVLEEVIEQDANFGLMNPKSLNVVRIPTVRTSGKVHLWGGYFKVGVTDDLIVDEGRGAIMTGFDLESGVVNTDGYYETGDKTEIHPVSKIRIKGFQIPAWDQLVTFIKEVADILPPTINYVGWDAVLTPKGWVIVEGNFYGQQLWQIVYERGMKEEFGNLIGWHMEEGKHWWEYKLRKIEKEAGLI